MIPHPAADKPYHTRQPQPAPRRDYFNGLLNQAASQLDGEAIGDPETVADLQTRLAKSLGALGYLEQALDLFLKAERTLVSKLGDGHATVNNLRRGIAYTQTSLGRTQDALDTMQRAVTSSTERLGTNDPVTLYNAHSLAVMHERLGHGEVAIQMFSDLLARQKAVIGPHHIQTLNTQYRLGQLYVKLGKMDLGLPLMEMAVMDGRELFGLNHDVRLWTLNLANTYLNSGQYEKGINSLEQLHIEMKGLLDPTHRDVIAVSISLANGYLILPDKQYVKAIPLLQDAIRHYQAKLGANHQKTFETIGKLANCYWRSGNTELGYKYASDAIRLATDRYGPDHLLTLNLEVQVGRCMTGDNIKGIAFLEDLIHRVKKTKGADTPSLFWTFMQLASIYSRTGKTGEALHAYERAVEEAGPGEPRLVMQTVSAEDKLAKTLAGEGQHDAALQFSAAATRHRRLVKTESEPQAATLIRNQISLLVYSGKIDEAMAMIENLAIATAEDMQLLQEAVAFATWHNRLSDVQMLSKRAIAAVTVNREPRMSERCAILCCIHKELNQEALREVLPLIRNAIQVEPEGPHKKYFHTALGMAEYRNGNDTKALEALDNVTGSRDDNSLNSILASYFRAMSLHRLGKTAEATAMFTNARERMRPLPSKIDPVLEPGVGYVDLFVWIAFEEAAALCDTGSD